MHRSITRKSQSAIYITQTTVGPHEPPFFGVKEQKCLIGYTRQNVNQSVEPLSRNRDANVTQNGHVYAICCQPEVAGDVTSGENAKTVKGNVLLSFDVH